MRTRWDDLGNNGRCYCLLVQFLKSCIVVMIAIVVDVTLFCLLCTLCYALVQLLELYPLADVVYAGWLGYSGMRPARGLTHLGEGIVPWWLEISLKCIVKRQKTYLPNFSVSGVQCQARDGLSVLSCRGHLPC